MALLAAGIGLVVAQAIVVPRVKWSPVRLLRVGVAVASAGFGLLVVDFGVASLMIAIATIGFGLGLATPGYIAGPSLKVTGDEQAGLAGLVGATNALTFIVAPTAATVLYGAAPALPIIIGGVVLFIVLVFLWSARVFRTTPPST